MSEYQSYGEIKFVKLEDTLNTQDDSNIGYFVEVDLKYSKNKKEKTKNFPFAPENEKTIPDIFTTYMRERKPITYKQSKNLICDWTDKKKYLNYYRMLIFCIRHAMVVDKVHEKISINQNIWLENYINFNYQK